MEITWYGLSCFRLTERGMATVVTDPYDHKVIGYKPLSLRGDIVSVSHAAPGHDNVGAVKSKPWIIDGPGEFEIGGVFITAVQTNIRARGKPDLKNILCVFDYDGITVAHLGDIRRVPSQSQVEALGTVLSPEGVLETLTIDAARYLGIDDEVGSLEPGKAADLVLVDRDPLEDVSALADVVVVVKGGEVVADRR